MLDMLSGALLLLKNEYMHLDHRLKYCKTSAHSVSTPMYEYLSKGLLPAYRPEIGCFERMANFSFSMKCRPVHVFLMGMTTPAHAETSDLSLIGL